MLLGYGFAKIMGAQFTVLDSELAKPMADVSGFWLTWYYFGYSAAYSNFVAFAQIAGAVLLCFRRTALAGTLGLLPVMLNIVLIDIYVVKFPFQSGALRNALYVLAVLFAIVLFHTRTLYRFFIEEGAKFALFRQGQQWIFALQVIVVAGMVAHTARQGYWLANVNNRRPTTLDGAWRVTSTGPVKADNMPDWIYFEYNRAFMVVFHLPNGEYETHDFRVNEPLKSLTISKEWLTPGGEIFNGKWIRSADQLKLEGVWHRGQPITMELVRKPMPIKDHQ
jgi:hypothetical protein